MKLFHYFSGLMGVIALVASFCGYENQFFCFLGYCALCFMSAPEKENDMKRFINRNEGLSPMDPAYDPEYDYEDAYDRYEQACFERSEDIDE